MIHHLRGARFVTKSTALAYAHCQRSFPRLRCRHGDEPGATRLRHWQAGSGTKVAVVGMGGLGHLAVKLAHAMGAEVTVLSQTLSKRDDGLRLGAGAYYATSDPDTFAQLANSFDLIIDTVSAAVDLNAYLRLLRRNGARPGRAAPDRGVRPVRRPTHLRRIVHRWPR
jgi:NADPH:quinone reductase-like Zn-dependent oxidoreductase